MTCAVAIFVKTPALSQVKTRMWPDVGREHAEHLYRASAAAVRSVVARTDLDPCWAVAEPLESSTAHWPDFPHVFQGDGSLGERMATIYQDLRRHHHGVILIGADAPQLASSMLTDAAEWLASTNPRLAIGPAEDGGFWLFGGNRDIPDHAWVEAKYSTTTTGNAFVNAMNEYGEWLELPRLRDLDTGADIAPVRSQLESLSDPTIEQQRCAVLLDDTRAASEACR